MTRFVLVHGAFMGSWCWEPVVDGLRAAGHQVAAPDLPGSGSDQEHVTHAKLETYVEHVGAVLRDGDPAVLVGHSLGGVTTATTAARYPTAVTGLVFIAAFLPRDGQSAADLARLPEGKEEGLRRRMRLSGGSLPTATLSARDASEVLFNACSPDVAASAASPPMLPGFRALPREPYRKSRCRALTWFARKIERYHRICSTGWPLRGIAHRLSNFKPTTLRSCPAPRR